MTPADEPAALDPESRLQRDDHEALRLWLRIFTCARTVERTVDQLLKREFGSSLARFDVLAQLQRAPAGLRMGELSDRTLTTNGNVTWLVAALEREGYVRRRAAADDGRAVVVRLTAAGRRHFAIMADRHEALIVRCFSGLSAGERRTVQANHAHLAWPFFDEIHRVLAREASAWLAGRSVDARDTDAACHAWVRALGDAGWLRYAVPKAWGGALEALDSRALCLLRETLAGHDALADFAFALQGLGSGAITLGGDDAVRGRWLPKVATGEAIAAFALSEPEAGSDAAALTTRADREAGGWRLDGVKTWISNGGIADFYCVFARSEAGSAGSKGISAFLVPARTPGLDAGARLHVLSPHPLATVRLTHCVVPEDHLLGEPGEGFKLAIAEPAHSTPAIRDNPSGSAARRCRRWCRHHRGTPVRRDRPPWSQPWWAIAPTSCRVRRR